MTEYIDKSALVAEIKRLIKHSEMVADHNTQITELVSRELDALYHLISFIDTLEVKEKNEDIKSNDLEEAARKIATRHSHITRDTYYANDAWFFKKGAQWQKEKIIDKACEWIKEINNHHYIMRYSDSCEPSLNELTEWFRNYMKEE